MGVCVWFSNSETNGYESLFFLKLTIEKKTLDTWSKNCSAYNYVYFNCNQFFVPSLGKLAQKPAMGETLLKKRLRVRSLLFLQALF